MKLLSHFGIAALVGFSASCLILLATYALGVWPWIVTATISWITYRSVPFALLVGLAAAVQPRSLRDRWGGLLVAILLGSILGFLYTFFVIGFSLAAAAFVALALSCWVPGGISAMVAAAFGKRLSVVAGIAVLCLSSIFLAKPIFNVLAHNQRLTVAVVTPSDPSTAQLEANPADIGFETDEELQTAKNEIFERLRAFGYKEDFRALSITRDGEGKSSLAIIVVRAPVTKEVVLPEPDRSTVVYVQQFENWEKKPAHFPVLRRGIEMRPWPPGPEGESVASSTLGYFVIPNASGSGLIGRVIARRPVQPK